MKSYWLYVRQRWTSQISGAWFEASTPFDEKAELVRAANDAPCGRAAGAPATTVRRGHDIANWSQSGTVSIDAHCGDSAASLAGGPARSGLGGGNCREVIAGLTLTGSARVGLDKTASNPLG